MWSTIMIIIIIIMVYIGIAWHIPNISRVSGAGSAQFGWCICLSV